jgi:hypothetical protein
MRAPHAIAIMVMIASIKSDGEQFQLFEGQLNQEEEENNE